MPIDYLDYLPDQFRASGVHLFLDAFQDKCVPILGSDGKAQTVLETGLNPAQCIVAISDGRLVGLLAIQTSQGSLLNPPLQALIKAYGVWGGIVRMGGLALLHHTTAPDEFYVDGVAVVDDMRGQGIGSGLFTRLEKRAQQEGIRKLSLDVIDTNPRAKTLYTKLGFVAIKQRTPAPLNWFIELPFNSATLMVKTIG